MTMEVLSPDDRKRYRQAVIEYAISVQDNDEKLIENENVVKALECEFSDRIKPRDLWEFTIKELRHAIWNFG